MHPNKIESYQTRMTVGSNKLDAYQDVCSPAIGITDTKIHLKITISDAHRGASYCAGGLKDFSEIQPCTSTSTCLFIVAT